MNDCINIKSNSYALGMLSKFVWPTFTFAFVLLQIRFYEEALRYPESGLLLLFGCTAAKEIISPICLSEQYV